MKTKKAKTIFLEIEERKCIQTIIKYICPSCRTNFEHYSFDMKVTRFICGQCGQELIIGNDRKDIS